MKAAIRCTDEKAIGLRRGGSGGDDLGARMGRRVWKAGQCGRRGRGRLTGVEGGWNGMGLGLVMACASWVVVGSRSQRRIGSSPSPSSLKLLICSGIASQI